MAARHFVDRVRSVTPQRLEPDELLWVRDGMVELGAILAAAYHHVAAERVQQIEHVFLPFPGVNLENDMRHGLIENAVVEAAGKLRRVAERIEPEADGAGREDSCAGHVGLHPL